MKLSKMKKFSLTGWVFAAVAANIAGLCWAQTEPKPPELTIKASTIQVPVTLGTYCWSSPTHGGAALCMDSVAPPDLLKNTTPTIVPSGSGLLLNFSDTPIHISIDAWIDGAPVRQQTAMPHALTIPDKPGIYIYSVSAQWDQGEAYYAFAVEVR